MCNSVSVIVPIHNSSKYLARLLQSLTDQTYTNFEALLIDDNSSDDSYQICRHFANADSRFKVFSNTFIGGVSAARNIGLTEAANPYITFIDADDYIDKDFLSIMVRAIVESHSSAVSCSYSDKESDLGKKLSFDIWDIKPHTIKNSFYRCDSSSYVWGRIYRRDVIGSNRFDVSFQMAEDTVFLDNLINQKGLTLRYIDYVGYYHFTNQFGLLLSYNTDSYYTTTLHLYELYLSKKNGEEKKTLVLNRLVSFIRILIKKCAITADMNKKLIAIAKDIKHKAMTSKYLSSQNKLFLMVGIHKPFATVDFTKPTKFF